MLDLCEPLRPDETGIGRLLGIRAWALSALAELEPDKQCACGREGSLDHEDFCMPKGMWPRHWITGGAIDPDAAPKEKPNG